MENQLQLPSVVELNVGGTNITTSLSTLTKYPDSMLAAMFSGRQPLSTDSQGRYFVDCDGDIFKLILEYLRFGSLPPAASALKVNEYARYFCLQELVDALNKYKVVGRFNIVTNEKDTLRSSGELALYEKIKDDILSHNVNEMEFQNVYLALAYRSLATPVQISCKHQCKYNNHEIFWYLCESMDLLQRPKAMQFDLENHGLKCKITVSSYSLECLLCHLSGTYFVHISELI